MTTVSTNIRNGMMSMRSRGKGGGAYVTQTGVVSSLVAKVSTVSLVDSRSALD